MTRRLWRTILGDPFTFLTLAAVAFAIMDVVFLAGRRRKKPERKVAE